MTKKLQGLVGCVLDSGVSLTKQKMRSKILLCLKTQEEEDRDRKSRSIKQRLFRTLVFKKAKTVMFYISFVGEVNTLEMIAEALKLGKTIAVPVCGKDRVTLTPCLFKYGLKLMKGPYGVREPAMKKPVDLEKLDIVIVPGVAFDKKGNRLGRGKGCYDRFLKRLPARTRSIGLAFDFQMIPSVPSTPSDTHVHKVIFA